jgi:hypothetical protein
MFTHPTLIGGWVNGNLYVPTAEVIGILPIPDDVRELSAMAPYVHSSTNHQKYSFIASMQGTRKPVLPVHTASEEQYFRTLMNTDPSFSPQSGEPHWGEAVKVWNSNAEVQDGVYYKVCMSTFSFNFVVFMNTVGRTASSILHEMENSARSERGPISYC